MVERRRFFPSGNPIGNRNKLSFNSACEEFMFISQHLGQVATLDLIRHILTLGFLFTLKKLRTYKYALNSKNVQSCVVGNE